MSKVENLATSLCKKLFDAGYIAYFAGGWVRDLLLGTKPDEIDIATNAPPSKVQELFEKTVPVGIAFGVVIVVLEGINFEVTTFRKDHHYLDGRHPEGVDFSTPEKDAERRDFTINGMFYDPLTQALHDYVGGKDDLNNHLIRAIGDPHKRFEEDRLRLIRAVRFAARFGFEIDKRTAEAIYQSAPTLLPSVSMERIWQELCKMSQGSRFDTALLMLYKLELLQVIFPDLKQSSFGDLEQRVSPFAYFPLSCPTIAYLLELFPFYSLEEKLELCFYLKTPASDRKLVEFLTSSAQLLTSKSADNFEWAHFYAHPHSNLALQIQAAKILPPERSVFLNEHSDRAKELKKHIERIRLKKPLIRAEHLQQRGILPGKHMGELLKEAERIAINENLSDVNEVISYLKF